MNRLEMTIMLTQVLFWSVGVAASDNNKIAAVANTGLKINDIAWALPLLIKTELLKIHPFVVYVINNGFLSICQPRLVGFEFDEHNSISFKLDAVDWRPQETKTLRVIGIVF